MTTPSWRDSGVDPLLSFGAAMPRSAMQRELTLAAGGRTHAGWHQGVVGSDDRRWLEWRLYEELRS